MNTRLYRHKINTNTTRVIFLLLFSGISFYSRGQIAKGDTGDSPSYPFITCKGQTETYIYSGGTSDPYKVPCPLIWTVVGGVFVDQGNATTYRTTTDASLGLSNAKVKWTVNTPNGTIIDGTISVSTQLSDVQSGSRCLNGDDSKSVPLTPLHTYTPSLNPTSVVAGSPVTLNISPDAWDLTVVWTNPMGVGNIIAPGTSIPGTARPANPSSTSSATVKYSVTANYTYDYFIGATDSPAKTLNCTVDIPVGTVIVSPSPVQNNEICCGQCIATGSIPALLDQASGTSLTGASAYTYIWSKSTDNITYTPISTATNATYQNPALTTTAYFQRMVNYGSLSNIIKISVLPSTLTIAAKNTGSASLQALNSISIQGDQIPTAGSEYDYTAGTSIKVLPETRLLPNVSLKVGLNCALSNGRIAASIPEDVGDTIYAQPVIKKVLSDERLPLKVIDDLNSLNIYPNPTNGMATIKYSIKTGGYVNLSIMDNLGRQVNILVDSENVEPGAYEATFNAKEMSPGMYFYTITTNGYKESKKIIIK